MHEKKIRSLSRQIAELKGPIGGKRTSYSQEIWDQIIELRPHFSLAELSNVLGISTATLHKKTFQLHSKRASNKIAKSRSTTLVPINPLGSTIPLVPLGTPIFEMELPSGAKIRIYS